MNAETFQPIIAHPFQMQRPHGLAWDNGAMWVVDGVDEARVGIATRARTLDGSVEWTSPRDWD